jgi:hypothetical protein
MARWGVGGAGEYDMPVTVEFLDDGLGARFLCSGLVTGKELHDASLTLFSDAARFQRIRYVILDELGIDFVDLTFTDLKRIEEENRQASLVNRQLVIAIVVDKELPQVLTRAWDMRTRTVALEKEMFRTREEAYGWLRQKVRERFGLELTAF